MTNRNQSIKQDIKKKHYYQRVLFSGTKVKRCLVQHLNEVLQTGHVDFVFHRLRTNKSVISQIVT